MNHWPVSVAPYSIPYTKCRAIWPAGSAWFPGWLPRALTKVPRLTGGNAPGKLAVARAAKARAGTSLKSPLTSAAAGPGGCGDWS